MYSKPNWIVLVWSLPQGSVGSEIRETEICTPFSTKYDSISIAATSVRWSYATGQPDNFTDVSVRSAALFVALILTYHIQFGVLVTTL